MCIIYINDLAVDLGGEVNDLEDDTTVGGIVESAELYSGMLIN